MKNLKNIQQKLSKIHKKVYIVGGYTREKIMKGKYSGDIDLTTPAHPEEIKSVLNVIKEVGKKYGTLIIRESGGTFEITTFRKDIGILDNRKPVSVEFTHDLILDSLRRDFTCNAIYLDLENDNVIDPQNGIRDIQNKVLQFIGKPEERIQEDALRILRFIRFKNKYNFSNAEINYFQILGENIHLLKNISIERIKQEFDKILLGKNNIQALKDLKEIGFFSILIPEIENLEKTPGGPKHHLEGNVWIHTLLTIEGLNKYFSGANTYDLTVSLTDSNRLDLYWTLLLHDIGKNDTYSQDSNGNVHYYNHEEISYQKSKTILKQFKFSTKSSKKILWLIQNHLRIFKVSEMKILKSRKFMMSDYFKELIVTGIADHKGRIPTDDKIIFQLIYFYNNFLDILKTKQFLTGNDILEKYPDLEGIEIKNKLNNLNEAILIKD